MTPLIWLPKTGMCLRITVTEEQEVTVNRESIREYVARQQESEDQESAKWSSSRTSPAVQP